MTGVILAALLAACATPPPAVSAHDADRLYVLYGGQINIPDIAPWTNGAHAGEARQFSDNSYLIKHGNDWMLWDSGLSDSLLDRSVPGARGMQMTRTMTLVGQLAQLGLTPDQIDYLAFSHFHADHVGNANLFTHARWYVQAAEYDAAFGPTPERYGFVPSTYQGLQANVVVKLHGDEDVFGDGSVIILSTPGHTPGHQSLLVHLKHTGALVLSGDVAHFEENFTLRRAPSFNYDVEQSKASMDKIAAVLMTQHATLWINHDAPQNRTVAHLPEFYD